jgi:hypothetical protein
MVVVPIVKQMYLNIQINRIDTFRLIILPCGSIVDGKPLVFGTALPFIE